jgi:hypothetical protein
MKEYWPAPETQARTIERFGELAAPDGDMRAAARAWSDAGFDDDGAAAWLQSRCFDPEAARALADFGVTPSQAGARTRDGGGYLDTVGFKVAKGDLTPRGGAARCLSSR